MTLRRGVAAGMAAVTLLVAGCIGGTDGDPDGEATPSVRPAACAGDRIGEFVIQRVTDEQTVGRLELYRNTAKACATATVEPDSVEMDWMQLTVMRCWQRSSDELCTMDTGEHPWASDIVGGRVAGPLEVLAPPGSCVHVNVELRLGGTTAGWGTSGQRAGGGVSLCTQVD